MHKIIIISVLTFTSLLVSCNKKAEKKAEETAKTEESKPVVKEEEPKTVLGKINEPVNVGEIEHTILLAEKLDKIPADNTIKQFKSIAKDLPAEKDMIWYHLKGKITNKSKKASSANVTAVVLVDANEKEFKANPKTAKYIDSKKMLTSIAIKPDETIEWEAYYVVPKDAKGLKARVSDLTFGMKDIAFVKL